MIHINWQKIETVLADIFKVGTAVATIAEPVVVATNPGIGNLYAISVNAASQAEQQGESAATTQSSDAGKIAAIATAVTPILAQATQQAGLSSHTQDQINAYALSVVSGLNALTPPASN